jgi:serine/threonine protein kinase
MAPELFNKSARPSEASDTYALGVLFYEIAVEIGTVLFSLVCFDDFGLFFFFFFFFFF